MDRIQTGVDLHALCLVDSFAVRHIDAAVLQARPSVREMILDHQVLSLLRVAKGRNKGFLRRDDRIDILHTLLLQKRRNALRRARRDLVDHGPGEGNRILIPDIIPEALVHKAVCQPRIGDGPHGLLQALSVVRAVVHRHQSDRKAARPISLVQHCRHDGHAVRAVFRPLPEILLCQTRVSAVRTRQRIPFLRNGKGRHLQRRRAEDLPQSPPGRRIRAVSEYGLRKRRNDRPFYGTVIVQDHAQHQIIVRAVDPVHDLRVEGFHAGQSRSQRSLRDQTVDNGTDENAEDVADPEMRPDRRLSTDLLHCCRVIGRKSDPRLQKGFPVFLNVLQCQFHVLSSRRALFWPGSGPAVSVHSLVPARPRPGFLL